MKLKEYLDDLGIPVAAFARKVGTTPQTIWGIINGKEPQLDLAFRIEDATSKKVKARELAKKRPSKINDQNQDQSQDRD
jgi:hypothetical protein